ncbi:MAG: nuclear transport factor 2 family protein [Chloracidobacterium sp.]|nr:nuclear transport factor 2 family protein [Chloracidobacterium sp.]
MKQLVITIFAIAMLAFAAPAQSNDEKEILKIHTGLEQAYKNNEIAPFEAALADDYVGAFPDGVAMDRKGVLDDMRKEIAKPTYKTVSESSDGIKVKVIGSVAYITSNWTAVALPVNDAKPEPHTDKGRYTGIYEKRGGKWMLVAEHFSEAQHDRKLMEQAVIKASESYDAAIKSRDKAAYERLLYKDYFFTDENGKIVSRADDIARVSTTDTVIITTETSDKKVRIVGNTAAVETGMYHVTGTNKGTAFDETARYTTTWIWRELRWQVIADHVSLVKK